MYVFFVSVFLSAGLLFQVQPIIAKYILPWFGGAANVWTICLIFFQAVLLLGYLYAHLLAKYKTVFHQAVIHSSLVAAAVFVSMPIKPDPSLQPDPSSDPQWAILLVLFLTIGLPYFLISASGPLLQSWYQKKYPHKTVYRLYSLSNAGSLLGLLAYPFIVEPYLTLSAQTSLWSAGFIIYLVLCLLCVLQLSSLRASKADETLLNKVQDGISNVQAVDTVLWVSLAAIATTLLLATTNQMTLDIASVPLLWILPLSLYLTSFIISFDKPSWYLRKIWIPIMLVSVIFAVAAILLMSGSSLWFQVAAYSCIIFSGCMVCHGELYRLRPHPTYLTLFYLCISFGGVLGGIFVGIISPLVFSGYWEVPIVWVALFVVAGLCLFSEQKFISKLWNRVANVTWSVICVVLGVILFANIQLSKEDVTWQKRGFYGVLKLRDIVYEQEKSSQSPATTHVRILSNGAITHGSQMIFEGKLINQPTAYYTEKSGVGVAIKNYVLHSQSSSFNVGIVGMGAATIASLCNNCSHLTFFEIDKNVVTVAEQDFSNLSEARKRGSEVEVVLGDARVSLSHAIQSNNAYAFDILAVDAFSGDAIPIHLLTKEAVEIYFQNLKTDGVLAIHLSNRHLNLIPVVHRIAKELGKTTLIVESDMDNETNAYLATWALLTNNKGFLKKIGFSKDNCIDYPVNDSQLWTDQYSNIFKTFLSSSRRIRLEETTCYTEK